MPRELDVSKLQQFEPRPRERRPDPAPTPASRTHREPEPVQAWPSREPMVDGQISIKAPQDILNRFKKLCKDDRRTYGDMLDILMNEFEKR